MGLMPSWRVCFGGLPAFSVQSARERAGQHYSGSATREDLKDIMDQL